jgi:hypothetical protein
MSSMLVRQGDRVMSSKAGRDNHGIWVRTDMAPGSAEVITNWVQAWEHQIGSGSTNRASTQDNGPRIDAGEWSSYAPVETLSHRQMAMRNWNSPEPEQQVPAHPSRDAALLPHTYA